MEGEFRCSDRDGIVIRCDAKCWKEHILDEHPEMDKCEEYVKGTIENPLKVCKDKYHPNNKILYASPNMPTPISYPYLRVVVKYHKNLLGKVKGYVKSAFPCVSIRKGDEILWEQQL
jgi:hypothetical protein